MLSVVIPTFNRLPILREVIAALEEAEPPPGGFELVIVSDGSSDGTNEWLHSFRGKIPFRFEAQPNSGPGRARNRGVEIASGSRVLFLGDDTVPSKDLLIRHVARAEREPSPETISVLGYTSWHSRMPKSAFLGHINEYGLQFGYSIIPDPENVPFNFFYTSNVSISRSLFLELGGFDTGFPGAAWEDVEFAYRAMKRGLRMVYEPAARAAHDHPTSVATFLERQERAGEAGAIFAAKHPELAEWLGTPCIGEVENESRRRIKRLFLRLGESFSPLFSAKLCDDLMRQSYLIGLGRGLARRGFEAKSEG